MAAILPRNELFRVDRIFNRHEYGVPHIFLPLQPLVAVDIGANVGLFALYLKSLRPDCSIHCFEPAPHTFELLKINVHPLTDIHIHPLGLGDKSAIVSMALHPMNTGENSIKLAPSHPSNRTDVTIVAAKEAFTRIGLTYIDILKIDTEGCEVEILHNLQPWLGYVGLILVEYHNEQDRRAIDRILSDFNLFGADITTTEIGTLKYINRRLLCP